MGKDLIQAFARLAVGTAFLSAVADRFGLWGPHGATNVAWGDFAHFTMYAAQVTSFLPSGLALTNAILSTIFEGLFGVALVLGLFTRAAAIGSACLLAIFGLSMTISFGIKAPLDYAFLQIALRHCCSPSGLGFAGALTIWSRASTSRL